MCRDKSFGSRDRWRTLRSPGFLENNRSIELLEILSEDGYRYLFKLDGSRNVLSSNCIFIEHLEYENILYAYVSARKGWKLKSCYKFFATYFNFIERNLSLGVKRD